MCGCWTESGVRGVRGIQGPHLSPSTAGGVGPEAKEEESWTFSRFHHGYDRAWSRGWLAALGGVRKTLAEVKVIGAVKSYYPKNGTLARRTRAVDRRGALVLGEYTRPLECLDRNYHNAAPGDTGPLVRRLLGYGRLHLLVMGSSQEGTKDLHSLLDLLADLIVRRLGLARGRELSDRERAQTLSDYRRILWVTAARASSGVITPRPFTFALQWASLSSFILSFSLPPHPLPPLGCRLKAGPNLANRPIKQPDEALAAVTHKILL